MTLPVSSYEELLARVRSLTSETIQLRREITSSLTDRSVLECVTLPTDHNCDYHGKNQENHAGFPQGRISAGEDLKIATGSDVDECLETTLRPNFFLNKKGDEVDNEFKEIDEKISSPDKSPIEQNYFQRNGRTPDTCQLWRSGPSSLNLDQPSNNFMSQKDLTSSVNYNSKEPQSLNTFLSSSKRIYSHQQLGVKVEMVYSLLSMLDMNNRDDMSKTFLAMSSSAESCHAMRQSGCLPLLVQLIHSDELNKEVRERAAEALHNVVHSQADERRRKREVRVLKLLQQVREYCEGLRSYPTQEMSQNQESDKHPINAIGTLMKFSFDAEHRQAICILGGLHAISELIQVDHELHGSTSDDSFCTTLRRYAGMSLTNLTFGDCKNKALLCSFSKFMCALVDQLRSSCEDLRQVTASVLRNLSWRADSESKQALRDVGAVTSLTTSAMDATKESTLKSILSALWNLSAHCSLNKVSFPVEIDICSVPGALAFLVQMLRYKSSSNTLAIVENAGGILRNISSHIAVREDYRQILRENNCFEVLLEQLKSPSLTIVSNACGTLWNLSARCPIDQKRLWEMGATSMLRSLVQSKHKMISMGSSAALKNLLAANPNGNLLTHLDSTAKSLGLQNLPTLFVRKKRALEQELSISLAETCENIDSVESPTLSNLPQVDMERKKGNSPERPRRSESRDSLQSTKSDSTYERINQITLKNDEKLLENKNVTLHDSLDEKSTSRKIEDQKLMRRYKTSMIPTPVFKKVSQDGIYEKAKEESTVEENEYESIIKNELKETGSLDSKAKSKKRISVFSSRQPKNLTSQGFDQCSLNNSTRSSKEDSFKTEEAESEDFENVYIEKHNHIAIASSPQDVLITSVLNTKESKTKDLNNYIEIQETPDNGNELDRSEKDKEHEGKRKPQRNISAAKAEENANRNEKIKAICSDYTSDDSSKIINEEGAKPVKLERSLKDSTTKDCHQSVLMLPNVPKLRMFPREKNSKVPIELEFQKKVEEKRENKPNYPHSKMPEKSSEISIRDYAPGTLDLDGENISCDFYEEVPGFLSAALALSSQQDLAPSEAEISDNHSQKKTEGLHLNPIQVQPEKPVSAYGLPPELKIGAQTERVADAEQTEKISPIENEFKSDFVVKNGSKLVNIVNTESYLKTLSGSIFPKFKVGSPITDSKVLQLEANKICCEIRKHQDFEMGCSLTSEVSLVSSSSFLDTGDYSLFESSADVVDFNELENADCGKVPSKLKSLPIRKCTTSQTTECISLPSLESLKNEQIEILDLDSSILSVASITSEIAEAHSKDFDGYNTYTKTPKMGSHSEFLEDTTMDATHVSNGDDTLNADSIQNNFENFDEDNSLHCQENLPLDSENFEEETTHRTKKKLTPKEKRKTFHERYKTYTIRDVNGTQSLGINSNLQGLNAELEKNNECCVNEAFCFEDVQRVQIGDERGESNEGKQEIFFRSKKFDEEDLMREYVIDAKSLNDLLSVEPIKRKELVDNAKLVAFSLKTAVQDFEVISDNEMGEPHTDIDTATYSKNSRRDRLSSHDLLDLRHYEEPDEEEDDDVVKKTARILKPNEGSNGKLEEFSKAIRGRRRPLYSSPLKSSLRTDFPVSNSSKTSQAVSDAKKPPLGSCTPPVLHREGTFTKEDGPAFKKSEAKNTRGIPILSKNLTSARSNNCNKFGPVAGNVKNSRESHVSKIMKPLTKANERRSESDSSQRRPFSVETPNRTGGNAANYKRPLSTGSATSKMKNSSSSQNVRAANNSASNGKSRNLTLQSLKSQSDASLNLVASKENVGKQKIPKKEVTSKIASLWRKVEESKQQNRTTKDNRVWISSDKNSKVGDDILVVEQEEILDIPTRKIVHSLTCQTISNEAITECNSTVKNSKNLDEVSKNGVSDDKKNRIERRNVISAVVSPYNYNPPLTEKATSSKITEVGAFHEGSMKITTV